MSDIDLYLPPRYIPTTPIICTGLECGWCARRVVIYSEEAVMDPPAGWFILGADEWICPEHGLDENDWSPSEVDYFAVIDVTDAD